MALIQLIFFCVFWAFSAAAVDPIREHPHSVFVHEGTWANFSCGIKLPGSILWRIGDLNLQGYVYNSADQLPRLQGVTAERSFQEDITGKIQTETIGIVATAELDGTPVECQFIHPSGRSIRHSFSKFALLHINNHGASGSGEC